MAHRGLDVGYKNGDVFSALMMPSPHPAAASASAHGCAVEGPTAHHQRQRHAHTHAVAHDAHDLEAAAPSHHAHPPRHGGPLLAAPSSVHR